MVPCQPIFFEILPTKEEMAAHCRWVWWILYSTIEQTAYSNTKKEIGPLSMHFLNPYLRPKKLHDMLRLVEHPDGNLLYISSYGRGLLSTIMSKKLISILMSGIANWGYL